MTGSPLARRRRRLVPTAVALVVVGLATATTASGAAGDLAGDAMYAALVGVVLAAVAPRRPARTVAVLAFAVCLALELLQLTGFPAAAAAAWWPLRYVLGTTFASPDLVAYAAGAACAGLVAHHAGGRFAVPRGSAAVRVRPRAASRATDRSPS